MEIIAKGRGGGKTTRLIELSAEDGGHIVCADRRRALYTTRQAKYHGLKIPQPITYDDLLEIGAPEVKHVYIDDAEEFLDYVVRRMGSNLAGFSINPQRQLAGSESASGQG